MTSEQRPIELLEANLAQVLDASPLGMLVTQGGRLVYANARILNALGASLEQIVGFTPADLLADPQMREEAQERARALEAGESRPAFVYPVRLPNREPVWLRVESTRCLFKGAAAVLSIIRDVSHEVETTNALQESEARYRRIFEDSPLAMLISRDGKPLLANTALARLLGAPSAESMAAFSMLDFTDAAGRDASVDRLLRAQRGEAVPPVSRRARRLDGQEIEVELISTSFVHEGEAAVLTLARDLSSERAAVAIARETEDRYRALVEGLPDGVIVQIAQRIVFANQSIARILGLGSVSELVGHDVSEFPAFADLDALSSGGEQGSDSAPAPRESAATRPDGSRVHLELQCRRVTFAEQPAVQCLIRDVTERRRAQRVAAAIYRIADASARALSLNDLLESVHRAVNELMDARNFFIALKDPSGENFTFPYFRDEKTPPVESLPIRETLSSHVLDEGRPMLLSGEEMTALKERGIPLYGRPAVSWIGVPLIQRESSFGVLVVQSYLESVRYTEADRDLLSFVSHHIAEAIDRQRKEDQIEHLAFHDGLTGLPNRLLFEDRLTQTLAQSERRKSPLSVLFVDLDRLKVINDSLGHPVGDEVLKTVGKRLADGLRDGDSLARRGGDEFLVLLPDTHAEGAAQVARKLIDNLRPPMRCEGHELTVSASCGIAIFPENGQDAETLLQAADIAMYRAKAQGGDVFRLFDPEMNTVARRRLTVETKLRRSIATQQIGPHFQPILNVVTGQVVGAEALLRWSPSLKETMPPKEFIPVAEQSGLIVSLGAFVLREALRHAQDWPVVGGQTIRLSINVAARQIQDASCVELILDALRDASFPPERLQLELSESTQITEDAAAVDRLRALRDEGVSIAIDDFGVGYSSLSRLRHLPFDTLKVDGTFIKDIATDPDSEAIAGAVIALGRNLGLQVVAEGVETEAQKAHLLSRGCSLMQGFLFAGAMPPGVFTAWVSQRG